MPSPITNATQAVLPPRHTTVIRGDDASIIQVHNETGAPILLDKIKEIAKQILSKELQCTACLEPVVLEDNTSTVSNFLVCKALSKCIGLICESCTPQFIAGINKCPTCREPNSMSLIIENDYGECTFRFTSPPTIKPSLEISEYTRGVLRAIQTILGWHVIRNISHSKGIAHKNTMVIKLFIISSIQLFLKNKLPL